MLNFKSIFRKAMSIYFELQYKVYRDDIYIY